MRRSRSSGSPVSLNRRHRSRSAASASSREVTSSGGVSPSPAVTSSGPACSVTASMFCPTPSGSGMRAVIGCPQTFDRYVRVQLRCSERSVTKYLLNAAQIGATLKEVCRGAMAQPVWTQTRGVRKITSRGVHHASYLPRVDASAAYTKKDRRSAGTSLEGWAAMPQPLLNRAQGWLADRHRPLLVAFTDHADDGPLPGDVVHL